MPGRAKLVLYIDLQQVYLLQSEAQKDKIVTFICEYFRHHGRIKHWKLSLFYGHVFDKDLDGLKAHLPHVSTIPVWELVSENIWRELNFFHMSIEIP